MGRSYLSPEEVPRDVGYVLRSEGGVYFFSPTSEVLAAMLVNSPGLLERRFIAGQRRQKKYREEGTPWGTPLWFPWTDEFLELDEEELAPEFRERVRKKEGTYKGWDNCPGHAIRAIRLYGQELEADVASASPLRPKSPSVYHVTFRHAYLDRDGAPGLVEMDCSCPDAKWTNLSGGDEVINVSCKHNAAARNYLWADEFGLNPLRRPVERKGRRPGTDLFSPFRFADNWVVRRVGGIQRYMAKDRDFASLEVDMLMALYGGGMTQYEVDRLASASDWILTPQMQNFIRNSLVTREVLVQKRGKARKTTREESRALYHVLDQLVGRLRGHGFSPLRSRCLEFGRVALHYENDSVDVNLVFSGDLPPFYVIRRNPQGVITPVHDPLADENPLQYLGRWTRGYDHRTMRETDMRVELPSAVRLPQTGMRHNRKKDRIAFPDVLRNKWRQWIEKTFESDAEKMKKYAFLLY